MHGRVQHPHQMVAKYMGGRRGCGCDEDPILEAQWIDLREKLRKSGYSAFTEEITTPHGKALRVRVGPELERARAQALRDRLQREIGHDGIVMTYP